MRLVCWLRDLCKGAVGTSGVPVGGQAICLTGPAWGRRVKGWPGEAVVTPGACVSVRSPAPRSRSCREHLRITPRKAPAGPVVEVTGDLDYAVVPGFRETVIGLPLATGRRFTLDLAGLAYCDSTGLTVLVAPMAWSSNGAALPAGAREDVAGDTLSTAL
ncbi:STAS domain-containing protein [Streptomyces sp. NPDC059945]